MCVDATPSVGSAPLTAWNALPKKDGAKILLDVPNEPAGWPPLKFALCGVNAVIKHYEVLTKCVTAVCN